MKIKVNVEDLELGMYVAELDRPWLESPFLFQGFIIETEDELAQLRACCKFVFVEDTQSRGSEKLTRLAAAGGASRPPRTVITSGGPADTVSEKFQKDIKQTVQAHKKGRTTVIKILDDARLGHSVDSEEARSVVKDLVGAITTNPNTTLWLTNLKQRHEHTANHCLNTAILAIAFARHLGLPKEEIEAIGIGALLHDVGIARTPKHILEKPARLTPEEYAIVKRHPADGYGVMRLTKTVPDIALDIIKHHHERIDGSGYPDGLKGEQVPKHVLIAAIADVYDSMTSDRIYRESLPPQQALTEMHAEADTTFGKEMMQEFIKCVGIYPIGSLVKLNTGALAIVLSSNPEARLKPLVMIVRDPQGKTLMPRPIVNLATVAAQKGGAAWTIEGVVNPKEHGIDVSAIAAEHFFGG